MQSNGTRWLTRSVIFLLAILVLCSLYFGGGSRVCPPLCQDPKPEPTPKSSPTKFTLGCNHAPRNKRVAIIGAGSAGASTAYYLAQAQAAGQIDPCINLTITIFERNSYIGGRSITVQPYISKSVPLGTGYPLVSNAIEASQASRSAHQQQPALELGGSIFVKVNTNLVNAAKGLGLTVQSASQDQPRATYYGWSVWDGSAFRFLSRNGDSWWTETRRLFNRYGLAPFWAQRLMKSTVGQFRQMYDAPYFPWSNLTAVVEEVGLGSVTGVSGKAYLELKGISELFSHEIIQAGTRVNYAQNLKELHGLGTMVCLATDGAMKVKGGNWQIFSGMIKGSGAELRLNTSVRAIRTLDESKTGARFGIVSATSSSELNSQSSDNTEEFDDVVIATPLQFSKIDTNDLSPSYTLPEPIPYVKLHVTLLATKKRIGRSYFQHAIHESPEMVFTIPPNDQYQYDLDFFSVSALRNLTNPQTGEQEFAYKIFSHREPDKMYLNRLFGGDGWAIGNISWIYQHTWNAYPYLSPRTVFDGPALGNGLWYTSGIEPFISTMETSSLSGSNVAALLVQRWGNERETLDLEFKGGL